MGELEVRQQNLKKLEKSKETLLGQFNEAMAQREQLDTTVKNIAGMLQLLDVQIAEAKKEIDDSILKKNDSGSMTTKTD